MPIAIQFGEVDYNDEGKVNTVTKYKKDGTVKATKTNDYKDGTLRKALVTRADESLKKETRYNKEGLPTLIKAYAEDGTTVLSRKKKTYEDGNLVKSVTHFHDHEKFKKITRTFLPNGQIEVEKVKNNGEKVVKIIDPKDDKKDTKSEDQ